MKKTHFLFALIAIGILLFSCESSNKTTPTVAKHELIQSIDWFIGRWENTSDEGTLSETWKQESDSSLAGETYFVSNGDTLFRESIRLVETGGKLNYIPVVSDQNDGKAVVFTQTHSSANTIVFENQQHDFPQKIHYTQRNDSLIAVVSGKEKDKPRREVFAMKRSKN